MAIYRFEAKVISRGSGGSRSAVASASYRTGKFANGGKSAVSAAAYRAGAELVDEQTGQRYDYTRKSGVLGAEIMVPEGAVPWMRDRQELWAAVERIEKRRDAQLARDFILTLPAELSQAQRVALTREFVAENFCARGLVADIAWHAPGRGGDERNFHAHVMVPMRRIEGDQFAAKKDRPSGPDHPAKAWAAELAALRVAWAETANRHLEAAGLAIRIDHRSLKEQGIEREPEPKLGPLATQIERQGRASLAGNDNREIKARNAELAALKAEQAQMVSEEARLVALATQRLRREAMEPPNEETLRQQAVRHADDLAVVQRQEELREQQVRQAEEQAAMQQQAARESFKRQAEIDAEEARKKREQTAKDEALRRQEGEIASPSARYSLALADTYDVRDPYGSLSRAAMSEYGAFVKGQEDLRQQIAQEPDAEKRRVIELRKAIEAHDYMAITSERLGGISATIAGREDAPQAILDYARGEAHAKQASELRSERAGLIAAREQRDQQEQEQGTAKGHAAADRQAPPDRQPGQAQQDEAQRGQSSQPDTAARPATAERQGVGSDDSRRQDDRKQEDAQRAAVTGRTEGDAALSDDQRAKLDRLQATRTAIAAQEAQKAKDRDRGGGGRSGR